MDHRKFIARPPRHTVAADENASLEIRRGPDDTRPSAPALLLDFSRQGLRFQSVEPYELGDRLGLQIQAGEAFDWRREATVRWRSGDCDHAWIYGCVFDEAVEWEVLGELLLRGVLSME